jgi:CBS domain-containing protein
MRPGVIVLSDDASVAQSQRALVSHGVHAVLVLERLSGRPVGWITTRGLLSWCERDVTLARAGGAVSEPVVTIRPSASAREALLTLEREGATRLLVSRQSDGLPEGVVADIDLLRLVAR